jgi:hypothetical protein
MPKSHTIRDSTTARTKAVRAPIAKTSADNTSTERTIENATILLSRGRLLHRELASFGVPVLKELCKANNVPVASTGLKGGPVRKDYVNALYAYVSVLVFEVRLCYSHCARTPEQARRSYNTNSISYGQLKTGMG